MSKYYRTHPYFSANVIQDHVVKADSPKEALDNSDTVSSHLLEERVLEDFDGPHEELSEVEEITEEEYLQSLPAPLLDEPLSKDEALKQSEPLDENLRRIKARVKVHLSELTHPPRYKGSFEHLLDLFGEKVLGRSVLMDIDYNLVGAKRGDLIFEVEGSVEMPFLEED